MDNYEGSRPVTVEQLIKILRILGVAKERDEGWILKMLQEESQKTAKSSHYRDE